MAQQIPPADHPEGDPEPWKILGPAIRLPSGRIVGGAGFVGHEEVRDSLQGLERQEADGPDRIDGFLDNFGQFLDRETARRLTGARRGETTEIANTEAGSPIREAICFYYESASIDPEWSSWDDRSFVW